MKEHTTLLVAACLAAVFALAGCDAQGPQAKPADGGTFPEDAGVGAEPCAEVRGEATDLANYEALLGCLRSESPDASKLAARTLFIDLVESHDGFPIVEAEHVVFVYVRDADHDLEDDAHSDEDFVLARRAEPIRVAGDFNGWQEDGAELQRENEDFFHRSFRMITGPADRWRYKLVAKDAAGQDVWFSDPLSRRFDYDENGRISLVRGGDAQGHLELIRAVASAQLGAPRDAYVYVPRGYDWSSSSYPVLYMHDGNNLFDLSQPRSAFGTWDADAVAETEIAAGRVAPFIIVGIPNSDRRFEEYSHTQERVDGQVVGGEGDRYADFIAQELKPVVDARYRTLPDREHTAVLGSSLGGLISFHIGRRYPAVFKFVGGMSSTFAWGSDLGNPTMVELYAGTSDLGSRQQVFYLDSGGGPGEGCTEEYWGGSDNYCDTLKMKAVLEEKGITTYPDDPNAERLEPEDIDIYHWYEAGAAHDEAAWHARLFRPLRLFFRPARP